MNRSLPVDRLPHQPPMRWIRSAVQSGETGVRCEAVLPAACGQNGEAPVLLGLEILAQAGAALLTASQTAPRGGRLLRVGDARWQRATLPLESPLRVEAELLESSATGVHRFAGTLRDAAGELLLEASFTLLVGGDTA